jgi:hypothetical protein
MTPGPSLGIECATFAAMKVSPGILVFSMLFWCCMVALDSQVGPRTSCLESSIVWVKSWSTPIPYFKRVAGRSGQYRKGRV